METALLTWTWRGEPVTLALDWRGQESTALPTVVLLPDSARPLAGGDDRPWAVLSSAVPAGRPAVAGAVAVQVERQSPRRPPHGGGARLRRAGMAFRRAVA